MNTPSLGKKNSGWAYLLAFNLIARRCQAVEASGNIPHARVQTASARDQDQHVLVKFPVLQHSGLHHSLTFMWQLIEKFGLMHPRSE